MSFDDLCQKTFISQLISVHLLAWPMTVVACPELPSRHSKRREAVARRKYGWIGRLLAHASSRDTPWHSSCSKLSSI